MDMIDPVLASASRMAGDHLDATKSDAESEQERLDALIRADYERCRPDDTFDDLKRRARFSKEDKGLLREWRDLATRRMGAG